MADIEVIVENSRAVSISIDNVDITKKIREYSNPEYDLLLVEMAVSTNSSLQPNEIDWSVNSFMNEGVEGIHIAVGDGMTGAHIDFICPGVSTNPPL
jgi:hypothetical protein